MSRLSKTSPSGANDADARPDRGGQSPAAIAGLARATELGCNRALLVPGDCPLIDPSEIDELLADTHIDEVDVVIVPDRHRSGTNALLLDPQSAFEPQFGPDSLSRHVEEAAVRGLRHAVEPLPSLELDIDTNDDLNELITVLEREPRRAAPHPPVLRQIERTEAAARARGSSATTPVTALSLEAAPAPRRTRDRARPISRT